MKYILMLLFLSSCSIHDFGIRKFEVGDCVVRGKDEPEKWETTSESIYIILEKGERNYLMQHVERGWQDNLKYGYLWEDFYHKIDCPK